MPKSIEKRGEDSYRLTVVSGYDSNGKQIVHRKTVRLEGLTERQQQKEAERQWALFKSEVERGTFVDASKLTFKEFIEKWLKDYAEKQLAPKTLSRYKEMLESRIVPCLGHLRLNKIQPMNILEFYNNLAESGMRLDKKYIPKENITDYLGEIGVTVAEIAVKVGISENTVNKLKRHENINSVVAEKVSKAMGIKITDLFQEVGKVDKLSERTILHHHRLISSILQDAVEWQLILSNPASRVKAPKVQKKRIQFYDEEQTKQLIRALDKEPLNFKVMVVLDVFTGLRTGELMGLEWSDIDLIRCTIQVNKASQYVNGKGIFTKDTKNRTSERMISISPFLVDLLKEYKIWQTEQKLKFGSLWYDSDRVFTAKDGKPLYTYTLANWFPKFLIRHNLPKITPHGLRHTSATLLASQGLEAPAISKRLGHARTSTTMDIYAHALKSADKIAADMLENLLVRDKMHG